MGADFDRFKSYAMESIGAPEVRRSIGQSPTLARMKYNIRSQRPTPPISRMGIGAALGPIIEAGKSVLPGVLAAAGGALLGGLTGGNGGGVDMDWGAPGPGLIDWGVTGPGLFSSTIPGLKQGETPVRRYGNKYTVFYITNLGRHCCQDKYGVWKFWRPKKHIVIPRDPRIGTLIRGHKRTTKLLQGVRKRAKIKI